MLSRALATRSSRLAPVPTARAELPASRRAGPAAVLCALFEHRGEAQVVLTRRSRHLREHGGQVAFPGGRLLPGEGPLEGALREAREEVGLDPASVEVIGQLTTLTTLRRASFVHCFVARATSPGRSGLHLAANRDEVERVFWVPLATLAADGVYHEELWPDGTGGWQPVPFFHVAGEVVWGATGRLLTELLEVALGTRPGPGP